jgi:hypothetical protein
VRIESAGPEYLILEFCSPSTNGAWNPTPPRANFVPRRWCIGAKHSPYTCLRRLKCGIINAVWLIFGLCFYIVVFRVWLGVFGNV